ncbi:MAG TPA: sigma-70 family RNA polymerase sigma factor [Flavobacteriaceae bacterium]|nr:sigma-70 family RNA polymerase sigma factor [Flavobacteriaceae bacterium]HPF12408.1 sigma-70 family RNA polymerase sigma factor [Flavobacteriaceae bacterium]HQU21592.1 sigma-70 family RNA polymerase sigma factor [Flavobacteriaceae bacterium]HQU66157.1 sigma-70 family RNA polymerase sigma factor [Flavobacteriaceae bacterium]HRW45757.1 sigma-70 family RNA polymerase sigma factor [Flavobacteriaceae bacterium]
MSQPDELILEMQQGSEKAFSTIYDRYSKAIYSIILVILKDQELAQEVLQDVFIKVWKNAHTYSLEKGRFYTWLLNIARNSAIDKTRSKSYKNTSKNLSADNFVHVLGGTDDLSLKTDTIGIRKLVEKLKPLCIQLLDLLYFKGYTQVETAEAMDTPLGTIKTRARNCINELRKMTLQQP